MPIGTLYIVSTPIGNLEDITFRAVRTLKEADLVAAEDTRRTGILLKHYGIDTRQQSYYDHNKERVTPRLIERLREGESIALVSDSGTPGISDPCYYLVTHAIEADIPVVPIPGPTSLVAALVSSGLPTDRFAFEGFLPVKKGRQTRLQALRDEPRTIVLFESPHRLMRTLEGLCEHLGDRRIAVARELTKKFEEIVRGTISEAQAAFSDRSPKGEFVLVVEGAARRRGDRHTAIDGANREHSV